jgi:hypothetical protein
MTPTRTRTPTLGWLRFVSSSSPTRAIVDSKDLDQLEGVKSHRLRVRDMSHLPLLGAVEYDESPECVT